MRVQHQILNNLKEIESFDPEVVSKVRAEYEKEKPKIKKEIEKEFREFVKDLLRAGFTKEELLKLKETKAYNDALNDPENIWCECNEDTNSEFKPDGEQYLGVTKHGYICKKCKKYTQIG